MNHTAYIENLNISTANRYQAIEDANTERFDDQYYVDHVKALSNEDVEPSIARHTFLYIVEQVVVDGKPDFNLALAKAIKFTNANPWSLVKPENTSYYVRKSDVDALGKPKQKKGAKKQKAIDVFNKLINGKGLKRKDSITILVEEVGLTPAGASTYYHNLQKGIYA